MRRALPRGLPGSVWAGWAPGTSAGARGLAAGYHRRGTPLPRAGAAHPRGPGGRGGGGGRSGGGGQLGGDRGAPPPRRLVEFFATCAPGFEAVVEAELRALEAEGVAPVRAGVRFFGRGIETGMRAALWLRGASRVLLKMHEADLDRGAPSGYEAVYRFVRGADDWAALLRGGRTVGVTAHVSECPGLATSLLAATAARNAVLDCVSDATRARPPPPKKGTVPDLPLYCTFNKGRAALFRDMCGEALFKRGYRGTAMHRAPLSESAAAAILHLAGWHPSTPPPADVFADPMCGSGTLLIEGAMMSLNIAPGLLSAPHRAFLRWADLRGKDRQLWEHCLHQARQARLRPSQAPLFLGNDSDARALSMARGSLEVLGVPESVVRLTHGACKDWAPERKPAFIITNPPWGHRLVAERAGEGWGGGDAEDDGQGEDEAVVQSAWQELGLFLKAQCRDSEAHVLISNAPGSLKRLHLKPHSKQQVLVGGAQCRLLSYTILPPKPPPSTA